jgi:hypothetical protein
MPPLTAVLLALPSVLHAAEAAGWSGAKTVAERIGRYNVVWTSPSKDASGVMPLGNGDIAAGVYAIAGGDLYLLLAKNDAYTYQGDIFKTGRVRISLDPNPFQPGKPFRRTLDLATGSIRIESDGVTLRIWADANRPVYHVQIDSPREIAVAAEPEFWQRFDHCPRNVQGYATAALPRDAEPTQYVRLERGDSILWYYPVGDRSIYPDDLKAYLVEHMASRFADPFRFNTFGNLLECPSLTLQDGALRGRGTSFDLRIHALAMSLLTHEDDRLWGRRFTFQNQRLLYWPLLASGDFDLM